VGVRSVPFVQQPTVGEATLAPASERALEGLPDEALAVRARDDGRAFGLIYDRYVDRVYRYVRYRTADPRDAEDLTSEVFLRALGAIGRYEPRAPFYSWIYRIARNAVVDHHRARREPASYDEISDRPDGHPDVDPERQAVASDRRERMRRAMGHLPEEQQEVIVLRFIEGLSPEEVAVVVGKRASAVRDIQFRALHALRRHIAPEELAS
jgi:RNA polymerase sigma-70 factor (ECF subfamily)